eukprot:scaffold11133_cov77-Skeletonema_marinoi.AAC.2
MITLYQRRQSLSASHAYVLQYILFARSRAERTEDHGMLASRRFGIIFCPGFVISKNRVCSVLQQLTAVA